MKKLKTSLILILSGAVSFTVALWLYSTKTNLTGFDYVVIALVFFMVIAGTVIGFKRLKEANKGIPPEDELSIQVKQKAAAVSFTFSYLVWTMILLFMGDMEVRPTIPIGIGIVVTGVIFLGLWAYYSKQGLNNGNTN